MPDSDSQSRGKRLKRVRKELGYTQEAFGEMFGYSQSAYQRYESGRNDIPLDLLQKMRLRFRVNVDWILTGKGDMRKPEGVEDSAPVIKSEEVDDGIALPRVSFRASAGDGNFVTEKEVADHYVVDKRELRHSGAPNGLFVVEVDGESMKPEFRPGEWLIMQSVQPDKLITVDGVYLYRHEDMVQLKRLQRRGGRTLHVLPANDRYPDYTINIDDATDFELLGSVYARFERYS